MGHGLLSVEARSLIFGLLSAQMLAVSFIPKDYPVLQPFHRLIDVEVKIVLVVAVSLSLAEWKVFDPETVFGLQLPSVLGTIAALVNACVLIGALAAFVMSELQAVKRMQEREESRHDTEASADA